MRKMKDKIITLGSCLYCSGVVVAHGRVTQEAACHRGESECHLGPGEIEVMVRAMWEMRELCVVPRGQVLLNSLKPIGGA